jgi:hypothetical protein
LAVFGLQLHLFLHCHVPFFPVSLLWCLL